MEVQAIQKEKPTAGNFRSLRNCFANEYQRSLKTFISKGKAGNVPEITDFVFLITVALSKGDQGISYTPHFCQ